MGAENWEYAKSCILSPKTYIPGTDASFGFQAGREAAQFKARVEARTKTCPA